MTQKYLFVFIFVRSFSFYSVLFFFLFGFISQSDMFSLGIIMYELYCPFKTEMEKTIKINDLKESGKFDEQMEEKFRNQVGIRLIFFLIILNI